MGKPMEFSAAEKVRWPRCEFYSYPVERDWVSLNAGLSLWRMSELYSVILHGSIYKRHFSLRITNMER